MYISSMSPRGGRPVASANAYIRPLDSTFKEQYLVSFGAFKACGSGGPVFVILLEDTLGVLADPANYEPKTYVLTPNGDDRGAYGYEHESEEESGEDEGTEEAEEASAGVAGVAVDVDAEFEMADADEPAPVPRRHRSLNAVARLVPAPTGRSCRWRGTSTGRLVSFYVWSSVATAGGCAHVFPRHL